jgi:hypothetical protein
MAVSHSHRLFQFDCRRHFFGQRRGVWPVGFEVNKFLLVAYFYPQDGLTARQITNLLSMASRQKLAS